jgi:hypothetical protein
MSGMISIPAGNYFANISGREEVIAKIEKALAGITKSAAGE